MTRRTAVAAAMAVGLLAGCSPSTSTTQLPPTADTALQADVLALTRAAAGHDDTAARAALARLRADLAAARTADAISASRASAIEQAMAAVGTDLTAATTPRPTPSPTPSITPTPSPRPTPSTTQPRKPVPPKPAPPKHPPPHHHKKHKH